MTRPAKCALVILVASTVASCGREATPTGPSGQTSFLAGTWRGTVTIQVNPGTVNLAPIVNAGPDQTITLPVQASLSGTVTDDGLPGGDPIATWSKVRMRRLMRFRRSSSTESEFTSS